MNLPDFLRALTSTAKPHGTDGTIIHRGCISNSCITVYIPEGFHEVEKWADSSFRGVWVSESDLSVITYCEGDIDVTVHPHKVSYLANINAANEFYRTH